MGEYILRPEVASKIEPKVLSIFYFTSSRFSDFLGGSFASKQKTK